MGKISSYGTASAPSLGDKLIGTSVGGNPVNGTYNFTIQQLSNLILAPVNLQKVLDTGNTATQSINLTGIITATTLAVGNINLSGLLSTKSLQVIQFRNTSNLLRWELDRDGAESTGNLGSNLTLYRYDDSGAFLSAAFSLNRSTGNVGIGTASSSQLLTVGALSNGVKRIYVPGTYNFDGAYLSNFDANGGGKLELVAHTSSLNSSSWRISHSNDIYPQALIFSRAVGVSSYGALVYSTPSMMINNNGNIGMGIASDSGFALSIRPNGNVGITNGIKLYESTNDYSWGITNTNDDGNFVITDTEVSSAIRFNIEKYSGVVTIGSGPINSALLNVRGDGYFSKNGGANITINSEAFGNSKLTLLSNSSGSKKAFIDAPLAAGTLVFQTQSTDRMLIDANGSLLINQSLSSNPYYKLQVTGGLLVTGGMSVTTSISCNFLSVGEVMITDLGIGTGQGVFSGFGDQIIASWDYDSSLDYIYGNGALRVSQYGGVNMNSLPTSSAGLLSGDLWRNGTVVNIVL